MIDWDNKDEVQAYYHDYWSKYKIKNAPKIKMSRLEKDRARKVRIIETFGGVCACCGEGNVKFLSIDHVKNDGAERRRKNPKESNIYKFLDKATPDMDVYQVLCYNCNCGKAINGGVCPHKT